MGVCVHILIVIVSYNQLTLRYSFMHTFEKPCVQACFPHLK